MNMHEQLAPSKAAVPPRASLRLQWLGLPARKVAARVRDGAGHYAAAAAYGHLWCLSDAALKHRGLSRDILVRDLGERRRDPPPVLMCL
jgi:hypothetical protein